MHSRTAASARRNSPTDVIIGNMIRRLPNTLARSNARSCVRNTSCMESETRMARHPEKRIFLMSEIHVRQCFIPAYIERSYN